MQIQNTPPTSFGMKIPIKTAIEVASGCFLDNAKISCPKQYQLLEQVSGLKVMDLYSGEVAEGLKNLSLILREKYPAIGEAVTNIRKVCNDINKERTFLPEDEKVINKKLKNIWNAEAKKIGTKTIEIDKISLKELGLDKYI